MNYAERDFGILKRKIKMLSKECGNYELQKKAIALPQHFFVYVIISKVWIALTNWLEETTAGTKILSEIAPYKLWYN